MNGPGFIEHWTVFQHRNINEVPWSHSSVQRESTRRLTGWLAQIALQPWMTEPKCHTQTQSSMRFKDLRTFSPLVCPTWSLKTLISEGTSSPRYSTSLGSHLSLVWVSWVLSHLPTLTSFWFYHSPLVILYYNIIYVGVGWRRKWWYLSILWPSLRAQKSIPSWALLSTTRVTLRNQMTSTLPTFWMPVGQWRKMMLLCPSP